MSVKSRKLTGKARKAASTAKEAIAKVPGPSSNPATNLLILDVAMRGASMMVGRGIEQGVLRARFDPDTAADIVKGRSFIHSMAATSAARIATRSLPGFLLVTSGLLAKAVIDRGFSRRESVRRGEAQLAKRAENGRED